MPKKKLFNGSNYVGAPVSDEIFVSLWKNSIKNKVSIADIIRAVLGAWAKSPHAQLTEDENIAIEKIMAQRKHKK